MFTFKKMKSEKASIAVYVAIVLFSFFLILTTIYYTSVSARKTELFTAQKIKETYGRDLNNIEEIYAQQKVKKDNLEK